VTGSLLIHATAVAIDTAAGRRAVLIRGPSGSGKSDLGLRLIDAGARLVADDQSELRRRGDLIIVRSPPPIAGLIEVRGLGIIQIDPLAEAPLALVTDLAPPDTIERLPVRLSERFLGLDLPLLPVAPFEASAAAKVALAVRALTGPGLPALRD
jgi:serine kinase of HPr protein (carbohydrate metabolism regulator)